MTVLLATRTARRRSIAFTVLLAVSLVMMAFSSNASVRELQNGVGFAFRPIEGALDQVAGAVASVANAIAEIDRLRVDNTALRAENEQLTNGQAVTDEVRRENDQLTSLLQLQAGFEHKTVAASVISRDISEFRRVIGLGKGTNDGIKVGDVVVVGGGALAGRVTSVGPDSSMAVLLTDGTSTVIGQLVSTAATGQVVGQLGGVLVMEQIDSGETISTGDEVVTAGIELAGGIRSPYPKGLLIGRVVDATRDPNEVVQTVFLEPAAPLDRLEFLLVITDYEGGITGPIETGVPCDPTRGGTLPDSDQPCPSDAAGRSPAPR